MSIGKHSENISKFFSLKKIQWREQRSVIRRYYPKSLRFALLDCALGIASLFFNPYRICRRSGGGIYGETPLTTFHRIVQFCDLKPSDRWLELGSGRGRGCFWMALFFRCQVIGVERVPFFYFLSRTLALLFRLSAVQFHRADFCEAHFSKATFVYLYGTCLSEEKLLSITTKMKALPSGARVVAISSPLPESPSFLLEGSFPVLFPWGTTEAFLHRRL